MGTRMWESVSTVGTGLGLAAFAMAVVVQLYRTKTRARLDEIKSAPEADRLRAIKVIAEAFDINIAELPEKERSRIVMVQLRNRAAREQRLFILFLIVALLCFALAATALITSKNGRDFVSQFLGTGAPEPKSSSDSAELKTKDAAAPGNASSEPPTTNQIIAPVPNPSSATQNTAVISDLRPTPRPRQPAAVETTINPGDYWTDPDDNERMVNPFAYASRCRGATLWFKEADGWKIFWSRDQRFNDNQQLSLIWFGNYMPNEIRVFVMPPYPETGPRQALTKGLGEPTDMRRWPDGKILSCEAPPPVRRRLNFKIPSTISPGTYTLVYCTGVEDETCSGFGPNFTIN